MGFALPYYPAWYGQTLVVMITTCCSAGFILFGYDQGVMSGIIGANNQFGKDFGHPNAGQQGTIAAVYEIGACAGSLATIAFGDILGRRRTILLGTIVQIFGCIIQVCAFTVPQFIVGRVVTGLGVGALTSTIPTYQSETCPSKNRGKMVAVDCMVTLIGVVWAYWMDYGFSFIDSPVQWRFPVGFQLVFSIITIVLVLFLPESPRWLAQHGDHQQSRAVIARLAGRGVLLDDTQVTLIYEEIQEAIRLESEGGPFKYKELLTGGKLQNFRRILLCIGVDGFSQLSGINLITYYAPVIFQSIGLSRNLSLLIAGFNATEYLLASLIPIWIIDRVGRRQLMITGSVGQALSMLVLAICVSDGSKAAGYVACACLFTFNTFFAWGWLTTPWLYAPEVCTLRIRQRGAACASAAFWICNFIVVEITPIAVANIGWRTYILFFCTNAVITPVVYLFFPETTSMPLECADHLFEKGGFTKGAHRGKEHVREVIEQYKFAHRNTISARTIDSPPVEVYEDKTDTKEEYA